MKCLLWIMAAYIFSGVIMYSINSDKINHGREVSKAIKECEAELSRHLRCEPVYGAKVVENSDGM